MVATAACGSSASGSTVTDSTEMRGSHSASSLVMRSRKSCRVVTVFGSKRKRARVPPKAGRRSRSLCSGSRMIRIAPRTSPSPSDQSMRPSGPTRGGKLMPRPSICPAFFISSTLLPRAQTRYRETDKEERHPAEDDVQHKDNDEQQQQRADGDDRNRERADHPDLKPRAAFARPAVRHRHLQVLVKRPRQHGAHEVAEAQFLHALYLPAQHVGDHEGRVLVELA